MRCPSFAMSGATAVADTKLFDVSEASAFAGRVEELSRSVEYLQLVAAAAVDRTRRRANSVGSQAAAVGFGSDAGGAATGGSPVGWLTGWNTEDTAATAARAVDSAAEQAPVAAPCGGPDLPPAQCHRCGVWRRTFASGCLDDGYRNTTEFLRARLRISAAEARRRLALAAEVLPRTGIADQPLPAAKEELAAAVAGGAVASHAASIITLALDRVRGVCPPDTAARMEHALTLTAVENDHDFLARIARRWTEALDQDGAEPSETELRQLQGAFVRRPRRGLQHLEIFATTEQFEHLLTVMNVATNPRTVAVSGDSGSSAAGHEKPQACKPGPNAVSAIAGTANVPDNPDNPEAAAEAHSLDQRSRPQKLLDGLIGACKAALASGKLPSAGGLRPRSWSPSTTATSSIGSANRGVSRWRQSRRRRHVRRHRKPACSPGPSRPRRCERSPAMRTSFRSCSAGAAGSWTSAGHPGFSRHTSARP